MEPNRIEDHIDKKIYQALSDGESFQFIIDDLKDSIIRFSSRDGFIKVSKKYIIKNWKFIEVKKKYTTYYVIHSTRRLNDIEWVIKNKDKFNLDNSKLFNLIKLKDKLKFNKIKN